MVLQLDSSAHTHNPSKLAHSGHVSGCSLEVTVYPWLLFLIKGDYYVRLFINSNK